MANEFESGGSAERGDARFVALTEELGIQLRRLRGAPSLSTSGETLTIEVSMNLEGENGARQDVGHHYEWSWSWA
jgi:hypothetical protein